MPARPRLLFVSALALFRETRSGGARRLYHLAKGLEAYCDVTVVCVDGALEWRNRADQTPDFERFHFLPVDQLRKRGWSRVFKSPLHLGKGFAECREILEKVLGGQRFDLTVLAYPWALSLLDALPVATGKIVYMEDDLFLETYRKRIEGPGGAPGRAIRRFRYGQLLRDYRRKLSRIGLCVAISEEEAAVLRGLFPDLRIILYKHALPAGEARPLPLPKGPPAFGFIGNYLHVPNRDSLDWLVARFLPELKAAAPDARIVLAGVGLPDEVRASLDREPMVIWLGEVADLEAFYSRIGVFINPIFSGRGLRTKLVEAAAYGKAILSTPLGAEGLGDLRIALAESPREFVDRALALAGDAAACEREGQANREAFERHYSLESRVETLWRELAAP